MTTPHAPSPSPTLAQPARTEEFAQRLVGTLNEAALALMLSIGHRTGLFDTMATLPPSTSQDIAQAAKLHERYVREWLGAMTTAHVVIYHPASKLYHLPAEHAAVLTRAAGGDNLANAMQWIAVLAQVENPIVDCFHHGGGVGYGCFHRFHDVMASESDNTAVGGLDAHILPLVPGLTQQLERGLRVLEIGCGRAGPSRHLAQRFPASTFIACDLSDHAIAHAAQLAQAQGLTNFTARTTDLETLDEPHAYDLLLAFDVIHDQKAPATVLANVRRALKPGGLFLMQDIAASSHLEKNMDLPLGTFTYTISTMHCMTVSLAQGGAGLGTAWGRELAQRMLRDAGFNTVSVHSLPHDIINHYYLAR